MKSAESVFEVKRFVGDVFRWQQIRKYTKAGFAKKCGVAEGTMCDILNRKQEPSLAVIVAMANICQFSLDDYRRHYVRSSRVA